MIKQECKRRQTDFSSFMRAAALGAMRNRTYRRGDLEVRNTPVPEFPNIKIYSVALRSNHSARALSSITLWVIVFRRGYISNIDGIFSIAGSATDR